MGKIGLSPGEKNIMKRALLFIAIILNVSTLQGNSTELILGDFSGSGMFLQEYCSLLMQESIDGLPEDFELTIRAIDNLNPLEVNAVSAVATDRKLRPDNSQFKHLIYARLPILVLVKADCPADNLSLNELRRIFFQTFLNENERRFRRIRNYHITFFLSVGSTGSMRKLTTGSKKHFREDASGKNDTWHGMNHVANKVFPR